MDDIGKLSWVRLTLLIRHEEKRVNVLSRLANRLVSIVCMKTPLSVRTETRAEISLMLPPLSALKDAQMSHP